MILFCKRVSFRQKNTNKCKNNNIYFAISTWQMQFDLLSFFKVYKTSKYARLSKKYYRNKKKFSNFATSFSSHY